jgi:hypothetical protein
VNACDQMFRSQFKTSPFAQFLRQAQILILKILGVFLRLKFSPSLNLNKIEGFEMASIVLKFGSRLGQIINDGAKRHINFRHFKLQTFFPTANTWA